MLDIDDRYDIILGMPWLVKHQPWIDWIHGTIGRTLPIEEQKLYGVVASNVPTSNNIVPIEKSRMASPSKLADKGRAQLSDQQRSSPFVSTKVDALSHLYRYSSAAFVVKDSGVAINDHDQVNEPKIVHHLDMRDDTDTSKEEVVQGVAPLVSVNEPKDVHHHVVSHPNDNVVVSEPLETLVIGDQVNGSKVIHHLDACNQVNGSKDIHHLVATSQVNEQQTAHHIDANCELGKCANSLLTLEILDFEEFLDNLKEGDISEIAVLTASPKLEELNSSSTMDESVLESTKTSRFESQGWDNLKNSPFYDLLWEFRDIFPEKVPCRLPSDKGIKHEIDLEPGSKYCVTRQWPLPKEQVKVIDEFFAARLAAGQVRESKSPHSSPTFCVKKATGGWRIVHAYNRLNAATIPAQTPIPRKDAIIDTMVGSTIFSAIDLRDDFYQILMRETDIPYTAVSTPSGMLWEWLVMPQGLQNAPATFNRCVSHLFRPCRAFAPSYFDDIYVHSKAQEGLSAIDIHRQHLRKVFTIMREHELYANLQKCVFGSDEIPALGCYVGKHGVRADPEKIKSICEWPPPRSQKDLRRWLGLANY